ncbi:MAG: RDD family protein [Ruminococcus sp.]|nr:RDD family protein [Ruminococcus sp.]
MQNNYNNRNFVCGDIAYAGFWVRLAAYFLDSVIVFVMLLIVRLMMSGIMSAVRGTVLGGNILFHYTLKDIVLYLGQVLYFILCTRYTGTTIGKKAMNLRVVNADGSTELDFLTVVYRETVGRFLCSLPMCIGYLMAGLDKEKRGIHDMLCDTRVVYAKKVKPYPMYHPPVPPMGAGMSSQTGPRPMPPMGTGMPGQPGARPMPPMGTGMPGQPGARPMPPMGAGMPGQPGFRPIPPAGTDIPARPVRTGESSVYPGQQDGPYRMVPPKEQNLRPVEAPAFEEKTQNSDKEEKSYSGIEEKEDFNRS